MDSKFKIIFIAAGMKGVKSEMQSEFPKQYELLPVQMYALRPKKWTGSRESTSRLQAATLKHST